MRKDEPFPRNRNSAQCDRESRPIACAATAGLQRVKELVVRIYPSIVGKPFLNIGNSFSNGLKHGADSPNKWVETPSYSVIYGIESNFFTMASLLHLVQVSIEARVRTDRWFACGHLARPLH